MELESDGNLMSILEGDLEDLDLDTPFSCGYISPSSQADGGNGGLASASVASVEGHPGSLGIENGLPDDDLDWPSYLQKVKETFIRSRPLGDIELYAKGMGFRDWMDYVIKLLPKDIKIESNINFKAMIDGLGPINKDDYRLPEPIVEVEFCEVPLTEEGH